MTANFLACKPILNYGYKVHCFSLVTKGICAHLGALHRIRKKWGLTRARACVKIKCMKKQYLECGRVCGAHGVRGALKIESWCDTPKVLASAKRVYLSSKEGDYVERRVLTSSVSGPNVLMTMEGVCDRDAATAMRDTVVYMHRDDIPLKRGQMFLADMVGLPVIDANDGRIYGKIAKVEEAARGLLYTIETESGAVLYPSAPELVKEIDPERGMLITPIAGFFD